MKKRNKFSLSHYKLLSGKMGKLIPIGCVEVLPGDSFQHTTSLFIRMAPMVSPVMHPVRAQVHHWFVPTRLLWKGWEDFITGGPDGMNTAVPPYAYYNASVSNTGARGGSFDYLGLPIGVADSDTPLWLRFSLLPICAYHLIYNECYRDQDLEQAVDISNIVNDVDGGVFGAGEGEKPLGFLPNTLHDVSWPRDYFTTARPWPQKGPQVTVPVTGAQGSININGQIVATGVPKFGPVDDVASSAEGTYSTVYHRNSYYPANDGDQTANLGKLYVSSGGQALGRELTWSDPGLGLNISGDSSTTLGSVSLQHLREAFALQRFEEHRAMYGSRYVEYLRYLGIKSSDARLQRPEYLGGGKQTIQFSEVLQTAEGANPVGTMRGHGIGALRSNRYVRFFEEHGYVISLLMIHPISIYMQGQPRMWNRRTKEDYWQKELEHIGQQEIYTSELYANGVASQEEVFGYQNRYDEYRTHQSSVAGEFRDTLNFWHLARDFAQKPVLNSDFISGAPTNRVFASTDTDQFYCMAYHSIRARRMLSKYGNPI